MNLPLNIDVQQILLHILNFVILFGGMYFILYSPVKKFMEKRDEKYREDAEKSADNLKASETAKKEYEEKLAACDREIAEKKQNAEKEISEYSAAARKKAEDEAGKILEDARKRAEEERKAIVGAAKNDIKTIAAAAAEKVVYDDPTEAYEGFLDGIDEYDN